MGSSFSKTDTDTDENISKKMDYFATYYILTSDYKSLKNLYKKEYCDDLIILTSDIIQKHLSYQQISFLQNRVENGISIDTLKEEPLVYFSKASIQKEENTNEKNKSRMCIGIAKFYIKVAHIFAAIITSVNPMYSYIDETEPVDVTEGVKVKTNTKSLCERRISLLQDGHDYINTDTEGKPKLCLSETTRNLIEEPGIPELEKLYFNKYDFEKGEFYGMTDKTRQLYEDDVKAFYEIFMDTKDVPDTIRKFSDIKIESYEKSQNCRGGAIKQFTGPKEALFQEYSEIIKSMTTTTRMYQEKLLDIINNELLVFTSEGEEKLVRINPKLTSVNLEDIVLRTRKLIIEMYLKCEKSFNEGVKIFKSLSDTMTIYKLQDELNEIDKSDTIQDYLRTSDKYMKESADTSEPSQSLVSTYPSMTDRNPVFETNSYEPQTSSRESRASSIYNHSLDTEDPDISPLSISSPTTPDQNSPEQYSQQNPYQNPDQNPQQNPYQKPDQFPLNEIDPRHFEQPNPDQYSLNEIDPRYFEQPNPYQKPEQNPQPNPYQKPEQNPQPNPYQKPEQYPLNEIDPRHFEQQNPYQNPDQNPQQNPYQKPEQYPLNEIDPRHFEQQNPYQKPEQNLQPNPYPLNLNPYQKPDQYSLNEIDPRHFEQPNPYQKPDQNPQPNPYPLNLNPYQKSDQNPQPNPYPLNQKTNL